VIRDLREAPLANKAIREVLAQWAKPREDLPDARQLGNRLRGAKGKVIGGLQLLGSEPDGHSRQVRWYVRTVPG
jgi:hypothetical protein